MVRMLGTCRPRRVEELVVETLLDFADHPLLVMVSAVDELAHSGGFFENQPVAVRVDGGRHVRGEQPDDSLNVSVGYHSL
jgi:hypothetical protein